jgi:hypothetical protein
MNQPEITASARKSPARPQAPSVNGTSKNSQPFSSHFPAAFQPEFSKRFPGYTAPQPDSAS